jgi:hypothetical protein
VVIIAVVVIVAVMVVAVPVALIVPLTGMCVVPCMILIPATISLGIKVAPPFRGLAAALAISANRFIQPGFGFLNPMLAFRSIIIGVDARNRAEQQNCRDGNHCGCQLSQSQAIPHYVQRNLLETSRL